jgi:hypothetical protein
MLYKIRGEKRWRVAAGWRIEVAAPNPRGIKKVARWRHFRIFYTLLTRFIHEGDEQAVFKGFY